MKHDEPILLPLPLERARRACREAIVGFGWKVVEEGHQEIVGLKPLSWTMPWQFRVVLRPIARGDVTSALIRAEYAGGFDLFGMFSRPMQKLRTAVALKAHQMSSEAEAEGRLGPNQIFISYRRSDSADVTGRLDDQLTARFGREVVFKDIDSIPHGSDFVRHVEEAIRGSKVVLAVIGQGWASASVAASGSRRLDDANDFVRVEVETALRLGIPVIPVLVQGAAIPAAADLPESLRPLLVRNGIAVRSDPDFRGDVERLAASLDRLAAPAIDPATAATNEPAGGKITPDGAERYISRWRNRAFWISIVLAIAGIGVKVLFRRE